MVHVADIVFERFDVTQITCLLFVELADFLLHTITLRDQIFYDQVHVIVGTFEVNNLAVHVGDLFSHLGNLFFSGTDISFKLFDLVVQHEFELFKLLSLFLKLINTSYFVSNGFFSLFYLLGLGLFSLKILFMLLFDLFNIFKSMF